VGESDSFCDEILKKINNITERLNFTMERAVNNILPFLDTILHLEGEKISFSVYRKPSNKEDYINYFSNHDDRTKRGIIIGFFLRAYRISSIQHLNDEITYIINRFMRLHYPRGFIINCLTKAKSIYQTPKNKRDNQTTIRTSCIVPSSPAIAMIGNSNRDNINLIKIAGKKIGEIFTKTLEKRHPNSQVYSTKCYSCPSYYIGETHRELSKRISEHKNDLRHHRPYGAWTKHVDEMKHLPNWDSTSTVIGNIPSKRKRRLLESVIIKNNIDNAVNSKPGYFRVADVLSRLIYDEHNINLQ